MKRDVTYYMADLSRLVEISRKELLEWQSEEPFYQPLKYLIVKKDEMLGLNSSEDVLSHRLNFVGNVSSLGTDDKSVLSSIEEEEYQEVKHAVDREEAPAETELEGILNEQPLSTHIDEVEEVGTNALMEEHVMESDVLEESSAEVEHLNVFNINVETGFISEVPDDNAIVAEEHMDSLEELEVENTGNDVVSVVPIADFKQEVHAIAPIEPDPAVSAQELVINVEPKKARTHKKKKKKSKEKHLHTEYSAFTSWLSTKQKGKSAKKLNKKKGKKKISKKERIIKEAEKSNYRDTTVISETLANILANQGHIDEAIEMYEQLSLLIVEKSSYFADRIQELKKR